MTNRSAKFIIYNSNEENERNLNNDGKMDEKDQWGLILDASFGNALYTGAGLDTVVREEAAKGKPLMGICLGMQLLFEKSYEYGEHDGLGLLPGEVVGMKGRLSDELMIPHIGWNALELKSSSPLFKYIKNGDHVYFVHSFFVPGDNESTVATAEYGLSLTATVQKNNVCGCQFHPEKSGEVGLSILRAFCEM